MMNEVLKTIATRYSCRSYNGRDLTRQELDAIAKAAVSSPSGMNRQNWRIIVVTNKDLLEEMETEAMVNLAAMEDKTGYDRIMQRGGRIFYHAPCMVFVPINPTDYASAVMDSGIVSQTIALAATSMGIDNVICGMAGLIFSGGKAAYFKEKLGFPEGFEFGISVLLGHSDQPGQPHDPDLGKISMID